MPVIGTMPNTKSPSKLNPVIILRIIQALVILVVLWLWYWISLIVTQYNDLQKLTDTLGDTNLYKDAQNIARLSISSNNSDQKNQKMKELLQQEKLVDVIRVNKEVEELNTINKNYMDSIQMPYTYFLHYFWLPPLNIWKNKFTNKIDDTLIWQKYLKNNNYLDVNLISKWTNFFKDIWDDSPKNEIKSINVWDIVDNPINWTFSITIDVDFVAQTKRSFLLLVDKISTTSNKENLWLMNEFFFNLWLVLKERDYWGTGTMSSWWVILTSNTGDEQIWIDIYKWTVDNQNTYIKEQDILRAIQRFASCDTENQDVCYFKFREKIRNLPSLAYTLWMKSSNKVTALRSFLQNLPPLINIQNFTFRRMNTASAREQNRWYEWAITIQAFGKAMSPAEVDEIATYLWWICLWGDTVTPMSPWSAIAQLDKTLRQSAQIWWFSNQKSKQFNDLRETMKDIEIEYNGLTWVKKVIRLFELYRMLIDNKLCSTKN